MSKYIDVMDIAKQIADFKKSITSPNSDYMTGYLCALSVIEGMIANAIIASTADAVEVVRCKDCKHYHAEKGGWCELHDFEFDRDSYCSDGERRCE